MPDSPEMLDFLKAMSSADRLRIIGLLTRAGAYRADLAVRLDLPMREAIGHLEYLEHVGVIHQKEGFYTLATERLGSLARTQLAQEHPAYVPASDLEEKKRRVLKAYLNPDGSLRHLPPQPSKLRVVLEYLIQAFTPGAEYTEREVNTILRHFHEDTAGLRRDLVDAGFLDRESDGSRYWRAA
jgi:hypothetical protein